MGACASRPKGCVGGRLGLPKKRRCRRRRTIQRRVSSTDRSNPNCQALARASTDAPWFDCTSMVESELEEDFYSFRDDAVSHNGSESASRLSFSSPKGLNRKETLHNNKEKVEGGSVYVDEVSTTGEESSGGDGATTQAMDHCGLLPNTCIPCLPSTATTIDKRRPFSPAHTSSKKKLSARLSFKWKEVQQPEVSLISSKVLRQRPKAGSTVPLCPIEKKLPDCWSPIEPSTFKVRAKNFLRDKKKDCAPNCAAYYPFGVDIFASPRKIDHIARFVELPAYNLAGDFPSILVVNIQVPLYPTTLFHGENDGEGMNLVMYYKLSENYSQDLPLQFRENITKLINDEVERVKGFPVDTIAPFRERLKILGRVANVEDLHLSSTEKKLMNAYNEKPVLSRPQHEFYLGENYFEIDLDMHRFSYISRKGFETFNDRLKLCILDFGLTIQGTKAEDLPEHILCCLRLHEIDFTNYHQLGI
ncbi:hypothetical protein UlMin_014879 [Ulmus minor]